MNGETLTQVGASCAAWITWLSGPMKIAPFGRGPGNRGGVTGSAGSAPASVGGRGGFGADPRSRRQRPRPVRPRSQRRSSACRLVGRLASPCAARFHAEPVAHSSSSPKNTLYQSIPENDRAQRQDPQRDQHGHRAFMRSWCVGVVIVAIMRRVVVMGMAVPMRAAFPEEGHEHQPPGIEAGHAGRDHQQPEGVADEPTQALSITASFDRNPAKPKWVSGMPTPVIASVPIIIAAEGQRDLLPQPAIVAHVLFVVRRGDHRARAKKQHRLEEGMGEQVEHRHRIDPHPGRHEHVAKLRTGRIGDHPLDVVLHQTHGRRKERRRGPEDGDEGLALAARIRKAATSGRRGTPPPSPWSRRGSAPTPASGLPSRRAARCAGTTAPICPSRR